MIQTSNDYWTLNKFILKINNLLKEDDPLNNLNTDENALCLIEHICISIVKARRNESKIDETTETGMEILNYKGLTGKKTRHLYNNLLSMKDWNYLEIGTWAGSSSISAIYKNKVNALFIDDWSQFGGNSDYFTENLEKYMGDSECALIESDCWKVDLNTIENKFDVYLYDGAHTESDHYNSLVYYLPVLKDQFIFIVDDWNWVDVRNGTYDSIKKLNLKVLYEKEIRLTWDNSVTPEPLLSKTWWNGIYVAILQK